MRIAIWAAIGAVFCVGAPASAEHLYPRNECTHLEGYRDFEMTLVTAVANRHAPMLKPLIDPDIKLDFGGGSGWDEFLSRLELPERNLWDELDSVLALGCTSDSDYELAYPWIWGQNLQLDDPFAAFVSLGDRVPLRTEPRGDAPIIRNLNWEAVLMIGSYQGNEEFLQVRTRAGEVGFAKFAQLRSEIDFRLLAFRREGIWLITTFVAGD